MIALEYLVLASGAAYCAVQGESVLSCCAVYYAVQGGSKI